MVMANISTAAIGTTVSAVSGRARTRIAVVVGVVLVAALALAITELASSNTTHQAQGGSSTTISGPNPSTGSTPSSPPVTSNLSPTSTDGPAPTVVPVVECPTTYGVVGGSLPNAPLPSRITVDLPSNVAAQLSYYSNRTRNLTPVLGPKNWHCSVAVGADGSTGVDLWPSGTAEATSGTAGQPGVLAASDAACQGCVYVTVCAFVTNAGQQLGYADGGIPCRPRPTTESVDWIAGSASSTGPVVHDVIGFEDPTLPDARNGIVLYDYSTNLNGGPGGSASQETCTLPEAEHALCTAILNDFDNRAWLMNP
jgi:hypothetical protein